MKRAGAKLVLRSVDAIKDGSVIYHKQDDSKASAAPKIHDETCQIDFTKSLDEIYDHIRGLSPYPCAWTVIDGMRIKIYSGKKVLERSNKSGWYTDRKKALRYYIPRGYIELMEVQLEGKKRMAIGDLLNGISFKEAKDLE